MKKYVLTDQAGDTGTGVKIKTGKFVHDAAQHAALLARLTSCAEHPGLAALVSPIIPKDIRLFQVHSWNVAVGDPNKAQNYTVIKELEKVPRVTLEMRMTFALLVLKEMVTNREFRTWAENWISSKDRSASAAAGVRKALEGEHEANEGLAELAAWGAASGDDLKTVENLDEQDHRSLQIAHAAELAAGGPDNAEAMAREIASAMKDIARDAGKVNLLDLVTRVMGPVAAEESPPDASQAAS